MPLAERHLLTWTLQPKELKETCACMLFGLPFSLPISFSALTGHFISYVLQVNMFLSNKEDCNFGHMLTITPEAQQSKII